MARMWGHTQFIETRKKSQLPQEVSRIPTSSSKNSQKEGASMRAKSNLEEAVACCVRSFLYLACSLSSFSFLSLSLVLSSLSKVLRPQQSISMLQDFRRHYCFQRQRIFDIASSSLRQSRSFSRWSFIKLLQEGLSTLY